jgi:hypothetical protein
VDTVCKGTVYSVYIAVLHSGHVSVCTQPNTSFTTALNTAAEAEEGDVYVALSMLGLAGRFALLSSCFVDMCCKIVRTSRTGISYCTQVSFFGVEGAALVWCQEVCMTCLAWQEVLHGMARSIAWHGKKYCMHTTLHAVQFCGITAKMMVDLWMLVASSVLL